MHYWQELEMTEAHYHVSESVHKLDVLPPTECARLQTVPEWYKWDGISDTKRYKMLGNGWTIEIIKHIFKYLEK